MIILIILIIVIIAIIVIIVIFVVIVIIVIVVIIVIIVIIVPRFDDSYSEIQLHFSLLVIIIIYHIHSFYVYGWNQLVFLCIFIAHSHILSFGEALPLSNGLRSNMKYFPS